VTGLDERRRRLAHRVTSLLLGYPDTDLLGRLDELGQAVALLPEPVARPLSRMLGHLTATPPGELAADYVATFDLKRRCCLYLTYYTYGDTRKRGMALLRFAHAYKAAGMELADGELADHLGVVLEFAAIADAREGERLLREHRAALELLRAALREASSPYADVLEAICACLPEAGPRELAAAARLARTGPPVEEVGLDPFVAAPVHPGGRR